METIKKMKILELKRTIPEIGLSRLNRTEQRIIELEDNQSKLSQLKHKEKEVFYFLKETEYLRLVEQ